MHKLSKDSQREIQHTSPIPDDLVSFSFHMFPCFSVCVVQCFFVVSLNLSGLSQATNGL